MKCIYICWKTYAFAHLIPSFAYYDMNNKIIPTYSTHKRQVYVRWFLTVVWAFINKICPKCAESKRDSGAEGPLTAFLTFNFPGKSSFGKFNL